jgi:hypothetical protein
MMDDDGDGEQAVIDGVEACYGVVLKDQSHNSHDGAEWIM